MSWMASEAGVGSNRGGADGFPAAGNSGGLLGCVGCAALAGTTALAWRIGLASSSFDSGVPGAGGPGGSGCGMPPPKGAIIG